MAIKPDDPIISSTRGDSATVLSFARNQGAKRLDQVEDYLDEVYRLAPKVKIDPAIVVAQSAEETGNWTSSWWVNRLNPAGIGITGSEVEDEASHTWTRGKDAARAQIVHLYAYAVGAISADDDLAQFLAQDPRYQAVIDAGFAGIAPTITGLTGRWAEDPKYATFVADRGNSIFPGIRDATTDGGGKTMAIVFGNVPHPPFIDRLIPDAQNTCFDNLGQRNIMGVVYHRMLGSLAGTDNFFRTFGNSHAHFEATGEVIGGLTDYGVDHETGEIRRWNDPHGDAHPGVSANRAAWASGPVSAPFGDGKAFLNDHGGDANIVNRDQASIEISGFFVSDGHPVDDPISDECKNSVAALSAYWADQFRIPWNKYPKVPGKDYNFTRWHQEYCIGSGKICPGQLVMNETTDIINRTKKIMKKFQEGGGEQPVVDDNKLKKFAHEREFHTKQGAISRKEATRNSPVVKNFQQGETITCVGFVHGEFVTEFNSDRWLQLAGPQKLKMHASGVVEPI